MFELREVTPRVQRLRERYRDAVPALDVERVRLLTDYYQMSDNEQPVLRRANALHHILSNMAIRVEPDELIVGKVSGHFRGCQPLARMGWHRLAHRRVGQRRLRQEDGGRRLHDAGPSRPRLPAFGGALLARALHRRHGRRRHAPGTVDSRQRRSALVWSGGQRLRAQRSLQRQLPEGCGEGLRRDQAGGSGEARDAEGQDHRQRCGEVLLLPCGGHVLRRGHPLLQALRGGVPFPGGAARPTKSGARSSSRWPIRSTGSWRTRPGPSTRRCRSATSTT